MPFTETKAAGSVIGECGELEFGPDFGGDSVPLAGLQVEIWSNWELGSVVPTGCSG